MDAMGLTLFQAAAIYSIPHDRVKNKINPNEMFRSHDPVTQNMNISDGKRKSVNWRGEAEKAPDSRSFPCSFYPIPALMPQG